MNKANYYKKKNGSLLIYEDRIVLGDKIHIIQPGVDRILEQIKKMPK